MSEQEQARKLEGIRKRLDAGFTPRPDDMRWLFDQEERLREALAALAHLARDVLTAIEAEDKALETDALDALSEALSAPSPIPAATLSSPAEHSCPNGPDRETGYWPCDPVETRPGWAKCSVCGLSGPLMRSSPAEPDKETG